MVERQLAARGVADRGVLEAMAEIPREAFVPGDLAPFAYLDRPLPIGQEQTISQPYMVAIMAEAAELGPGDRVLEVGTGSGYAAAVYARLASDVLTVERLPSLAEEAETRFQQLGYDNIRVTVRDGTLGWPQYAPYDAIVVAAGGPNVPDALLGQLGRGGRLVMPVGSDPRTQELVRVTQISENDFDREELGSYLIEALDQVIDEAEASGLGACALDREGNRTGRIFCDGLFAKASSHLSEGLDDNLIVWIIRQLSDKGAIDLQIIYRQML
jgi:protein-L-isoaspartate(D-aspartate) O-methyltransferase